MRQLALLAIFAIMVGVGATPGRLWKHSMMGGAHEKRENGRSKISSLNGQAESLGSNQYSRRTRGNYNQRNSLGSTLKHVVHGGPSKKSLKAELETLYNEAEFLIEGVGQILVATDNMKVEDKMLEEMDDRLVYLYKYVEDDIDQLLMYLKQVTDTANLKTLIKNGDLDVNEEFEVIGSLAAPDPNKKGDWNSKADLHWDRK